jgi:tripartite-type tricarboxylate transporter receptor subunit TctC
VKTLTRRILLATLMCGLAVPAFAQSFPSKGVSMIIPFPPGGGNDIVGRYVADELAKKWGKPVVPENRGGAGGSIGSSAVARAAPDGHTLLFISASYTINAATLQLTFDPIADLSLVATTGATDMVVTVPEHVTAKSLKELIDASKSKKVLAATIGGAVEFATLLTIDVAGLNATRVPYKGAGDIFPDLLGGRMDVYVGTASAVLPLINDKKLRPLATTGLERIKTLPDVPTLKELGMPGGVMEIWWGVLVPSKTPMAIQEQINRDVAEIMSRPAAAEFLAKQDARPKLVTIKEGADLVKREIETWKTLGSKFDLKPQ